MKIRFSGSLILTSVVVAFSPFSSLQNRRKKFLRVLARKKPNAGNILQAYKLPATVSTMSPHDQATTDKVLSPSPGEDIAAEKSERMAEGRNSFRSTVIDNKASRRSGTSDATECVEELTSPLKSSTVTFASSHRLYHLDTLWSDEVKKDEGDSEDSVPDLISDSASIYSTSDESSVSSEKSLAAALNVDFGPQWKKLIHRPKVFGHRGSLYQEPENTVSSFQATADLGCDGTELDVFLLKCGTLVVFHGEGGDENPGRLETYCGVEGSILDYTAEEARRLPFFPHGNIYPCPRHKLESATIPTLEEVLEHAKESGITLKIELKGPGTEVPALELVERMGMIDQCHFASFHHDRVHKIRQLRPDRHPDGTHVVRTACLFSEVPDDFIDRARRVDASEVHLRYNTCTPERVRAIHEAGMGSLAWFCGPNQMKQHVAEMYLDVGNEDDVMYNLVMSSGVMAMCVNRPDVLLNMMTK